MKKILSTVLLFGLVLSCLAQKATFTNPLLPSGADPYSFYKDGYYYYTNTTGHNIVLWKSKSIADLKTAPKKVIWTPPAGTNYSKEIWAPEVLFLKGKWYAYFAADDGKNDNHRMYVLENSSADPMKGEWVFKGKVGDSTNRWAIDGDIAEIDNQLYMIWSGWEGSKNGKQEIFIAKLKNPWTVAGERVKISVPTYKWETIGDLHDDVNPPHVDVNEGPQFLRHGDKIFIIFSASGCWTDFYTLGLLSASAGSDLLKPASWKKSEKPVFKQSPEHNVYAPGHNSFFKSPDGTEDWILYHANNKPGLGCGGFRSPRAQKFTWNEDGTPNFGEPVKEGVELPVPSESK
ncbi:family 43 glycosylhydrolase [Pedobacter sp. HMF7647]|uniref:Family 43 glycosylhydrolase n=1 Tax=Hufsiella arboris TaxID=2695275 RepID=A0A7K1Y9G3_9SPHI|nr:glycoside hydrolase family 43 protein [Hufsiella arboris]MXV50991.1 family 43 glycosylhydrolase [Hufsiella arboris]